MDVNRKALKAALAAVGKAVSSRPGIPALTGVLVETSADDWPGRITLSMTDLECSSRVTLEASTILDGTDPFLVPFKVLSTIVRAGTSETVTITHDNAAAFVDGARVRLLPVDDFPRMTWPDYYNANAGFYAAEFAEMIRRVEPVTSRDETRPVLTGVLLKVTDGHAEMVATDSYRLVVGELEAMGPHYELNARIIPARALKAIAGILGRKASGAVMVEAGESDITFQAGNVELRSRVIEGDFPNYAQLIPDADAEGTGTLTYDRDELAEAFRASAPFTDYNPIRLDLNGHVIVSASTPDLGAFSVDLASGEWTGEDFSTAFNRHYLAEAVNATDGAPMKLRDGLKPVVLRGAGVTALVMPVRLPAPVS